MLTCLYSKSVYLNDVGMFVYACEIHSFEPCLSKHSATYRFLRITWLKLIELIWFFLKNMKTMKTVWFFCVLTVLFRKYGELDNFVCLKDTGLWMMAVYQVQPGISSVPKQFRVSLWSISSSVCLCTVTVNLNDPYLAESFCTYFLVHYI